MYIEDFLSPILQIADIKTYQSSSPLKGCMISTCFLLQDSFDIQVSTSDELFSNMTGIRSCKNLKKEDASVVTIVHVYLSLSIKYILRSSAIHLLYIYISQIHIILLLLTINMRKSIKTSKKHQFSIFSFCIIWNLFTTF